MPRDRDALVREAHGDAIALLTAAFDSTLEVCDVINEMTPRQIVASLHVMIGFTQGSLLEAAEDMGMTINELLADLAVFGQTQPVEGDQG